MKLRDPITAGHSHAMEARRQIDRRLPQKLDFPQLAGDLGIGRRHLNRCFKDYYGISLKEYVHIRRLHEVRNLLQDPWTDFNVTEAALACGFEHLGRFSADYKVLFEESPRQTLHGTIHSK